MPHKILLIDDDADDRELFCEALEDVEPGITCYTAAEGRKALFKLKNKEIEIPDIIFLDVNMPIMSGWHCLSILKGQEAYPDIPVIMYSTSSLQEDIDKARRSGALCYFTKPNNFKDLKKTIYIFLNHLNTNSLSALALPTSIFATSSTDSKFD